MACDNEWCDPVTGNDCAKCFKLRYEKYQKAVSCMASEDFKRLAKEYKGLSDKSDAILKEIEARFGNESVAWWVNANNDILPQHRCLDDSQNSDYWEE